MSMRMIKELRTGSPLGSLLALGIKEVETKSKADEIYRTTVPLLHERIKLGKGVDDSLVLNAQNTLINLAPFGARRRNFKLRYTGSTANLLKLPRNPERLPYGCWW